MTTIYFYAVLFDQKYVLTIFAKGGFLNKCHTSFNEKFCFF